MMSKQISLGEKAVAMDVTVYDVSRIFSQEVSQEDKAVKRCDYK